MVNFAPLAKSILIASSREIEWRICAFTTLTKVGTQTLVALTWSVWLCYPDYDVLTCIGADVSDREIGTSDGYDKDAHHK